MTIVAIFHGEIKAKVKNPKQFEPLSFDEACRLMTGEHIYFVTKYGTVARAKVNGAPIIRKRKPGFCEVPLKYGLYDYFHAIYENGSPKIEQLVKQVL